MFGSSDGTTVLLSSFLFFLQTSNQHFPLSENHDGNKEKVINLPDNPLHMSPELECVCTMGVSEGTSPYIIWHIHLSAHSKNSLRWWLSQLVFPQLIMNCPSTPRSVLYSGKFNIYGSLRAVQFLSFLSWWRSCENCPKLQNKNEPPSQHFVHLALLGRTKHPSCRGSVLFWSKPKCQCCDTWTRTCRNDVRVVSPSNYMVTTWLSYVEMEGMVVALQKRKAAKPATAAWDHMSAFVRRLWDNFQPCFGFFLTGGQDISRLVCGAETLGRL